MSERKVYFFKCYNTKETCCFDPLETIPKLKNQILSIALLVLFVMRTIFEKHTIILSLI